MRDLDTIVKAYDIRGTYPDQIDSDTCHALGVGFAVFIRDAEPDTISRILDGTIDIIVNTPYGVGARLDGYEIRSAAVTKGVPCITTVQGLGAAVQGIEAMIRGEVGVRSLQEHAADLQKARSEAS